MLPLIFTAPNGILFFTTPQTGLFLLFFGMAASGVTPSEFHNFIEGQGKSGQLSMRTLQEGSTYIAFAKCLPQIHAPPYISFTIAAGGIRPEFSSGILGF